MARYLKPDLLILDDMGMKHLPKRSGEYLFEIIQMTGKSYRLRGKAANSPEEPTER